MHDPYEVLDISQTASDQQIKEAYRKLAIKYSSDDYATSDLKTIAAQKLSALDDAYDQIMSQRRVGGNAADKPRSSAASHAYTANEPYAGPAGNDYDNIRQCINNGDTAAAEQQLLAIDQSKRGAEWNFLMGAVCQNKGWLDESYRYYANAYQQDPDNMEYASAYDRMQRERRSGSTYHPGTSSRQNSSTNDCCNLLECACCLSLCSNCCCGRR